MRIIILLLLIVEYVNNTKIRMNADIDVNIVVNIIVAIVLSH